MLFKQSEDTRIIEGFLSEYSIQEPPQSWRCKTVVSKMDKEGRFNYIKKQVITPLHPPVIRSNGELYLYQEHDNIHEYNFTSDDMIRADRNNNRVVIVSKEQEELLKNHYVRLRCTSEYKDGREYLRVTKVLSKKRKCHEAGRITLGIEINLKPKIDNPELFSKFMNITLERLCKGSYIDFYEYEKCHYAEIKEDYFVHYKEPYILGIYSRTDGKNKEEYKKCYETLGRIHDLFRKHIDMSVNFDYNFVSDKNILLSGIR